MIRVMRLWAVLVALAMTVVSSGPGAASVDTLPSIPQVRAAAPSPLLAAPDSGPDSPADASPVWAGFAATHGASDSLAAYALADLDVYDAPGSASRVITLPSTTILGTVTVLGVIGMPGGDWVEVMLPTRPNGSTGFVDIADVALYVADSQLLVDLSDRRLSYYVDGVEVLATDVGVGSVHNPTPTGEFFVTDSVTLADPNSPWGPHALGLSARSETITEFNGGDGIIGIHGTNNPGSIGGNISLGCLRLPNEMITALHSMVPIGTRVEIRA